MHQHHTALDESSLAVGAAMRQTSTQIGGRTSGVVSRGIGPIEDAADAAHKRCQVSGIRCQEVSGFRYQALFSAHCPLPPATYNSRCGMTNVSPGWIASARSMPCCVFL